LVQLAEREQSQWEQSRQEQSERGGFGDSSGAITTSISTCAAGATRSASAAVQTADAGRAGVGDGVVAGKGNVTG